MATATPAKPKEEKAAGNNGTLAKYTGSSLTFFDRIADPIAAIERLGNWFYQSKMLGCTMPAQGQVLAMACLALRKTPLDIVATYHIIGGRLSMRADAMLAEFHRLGGKHTIIQRDSERAEIELEIDGKAVSFSLSWAEAQQEPFVYAKDGKTPKDNWATPRARMQMLWARVVSDGINAMCPEVSRGLYPPEVTADITGIVYVPSEQVVDAEYAAAETAEPEPEPPAAAAEHAATPAADPPSTKPLARENGGVSAILSEQERAAKAAKPVPETPVPTDASGEQPISRGQLQEIKKYKDLLQLGEDKWRPMMQKLGVNSAKELTFAGGVRLINFLQKKWASVRTPEQQAAEDHDELSKWADQALQPKQPETAAGN